MDKNKVSILIPVYNREKMIGQCIESALNQTYENIEVVVVDNKSTDKTFEKALEYSNTDNRVKVYQNIENLGPVRNWIKCLEYSTSEYIKFLWSDDWMDNDFIEKTVPYLNDTNIGFAYSSTYTVYDDKKEITYKISDEDKVYSSTDFIRRSLFQENVPVSPGCAIFRRKDVIKNLIIDIPNEDNLDFNRYGAGTDQLVFLLTALNYSNIAFVNNTKCYFRAHKGSFSCSVDLDIYYLWAKLYCLKKMQNKVLKAEFKTYLIFKALLNRKLSKLNKALDVKPSYTFIFKYIRKRLMNKIAK